MTSLSLSTWLGFRTKHEFLLVEQALRPSRELSVTVCFRQTHEEVTLNCQNYISVALRLEIKALPFEVILLCEQIQIGILYFHIPCVLHLLSESVSAYAAHYFSGLVFFLFMYVSEYRHRMFYFFNLLVPWRQSALNPACHFA